MSVLQLSLICEAVTAHRHERKVLQLYTLVLQHMDYVHVTRKFYTVAMLIT